MGDSELPDPEQARSIVCEYCLKSFSSGKAYGGHKRIHLQQHTMTTTTSKFIKDEKEEEEEEEPPAAADTESDQNNKQTLKKQIIRCSLCSRFFKSWKSLFGHMRAHPERYWRGIKPPSSFTINNNLIVDHNNSYNASSTSSTISNLQLQIREEEYEDDFEDFSSYVAAIPAQVLDLADSLGGRSWLSCDMRGRKAKNTNNLAHHMNSAVDHLLMLADQAQNHCNREEKYDSSSSALSEAAPQQEKSVESISAGDDDDALIDPIPKEKKKKMKVEKLVDYTNNSNSNVTRQCVCSLCNKSFPCYQALGGHMASHNKGIIKKMMDQEGELDQLLDTSKVPSSSGSGGRGSVKMEEDDHQCNICGVSFPTGQALGGHKKRHWWSPNNSSSGGLIREVTTTNSKAQLQNPSRVKKLEFDLYELPNSQRSD